MRNHITSNNNTYIELYSIFCSQYHIANSIWSTIFMKEFDY